MIAAPVAPLTANRTAETLRAAAALLVADGWIQGGLGGPRGFCAVGALLHVAGIDDYAPYGAYTALHHEVGALVTGWNDQPGQTAANVIATMRRVADKLEAA